MDVIQSLWIGRPLSPIERLSIGSFLRNGHEYHLYCYEDTAGVPAGTIIRDGNEVLPATEIFFYQQGPGRGSVGAFSDWFRYKLLLDKGGWWADTDVVCLRPWDFPEPVLFASERTRGTRAKLASCAIKVPRGHHIMAMCCEIASKADRSTVRWGEVGPDLLTRVVAEDGLRDPIAAPAVFCPIPWRDWRTVLADDPRPALSFVTDRSYSIHLWHEMWRRAGLDDARDVPPTSLFAQLAARYEVELT